MVLEERSYDHVQSRLDVQWTMLREAGFTDFDGYDTSSKAPFHLGSRMLALVATKA
jgi:hypothetical protein